MTIIYNATNTKGVRAEYSFAGHGQDSGLGGALIWLLGYMPAGSLSPLVPLPFSALHPETNKQKNNKIMFDKLEEEENS